MHIRNVPPSRWAARAVAGLGLLLVGRLLVVGLLAAVGAGSRRPWPLSLKGSDDPIPDGSHNFGAAETPVEPPPGSPWHPPRASLYSNLTAVWAARGVPGFRYADGEEEEEENEGDADDTANWCNMPHVRRATYAVPPPGRRLVYVEVLQRHHKRTPYAANTVPQEPAWSCEDAFLGTAVGVVAEQDGGRQQQQQQQRGRTRLRPLDPPDNPFRAAGTASGVRPPPRGSSCRFPQLTAGGLADAWRHGRDLYAVYHDLLGLLPAAADDDDGWRARVVFRVTNNPLTSQTAAMVAAGMRSGRGSGSGGGDGETPAVVDVLVEPPGVDSLEPQYACPAAAALRDAVAAAPAWADHRARLAPLLADLDAASGVDEAAAAFFHASADPYCDNVAARRCHGRAGLPGIAPAAEDALLRAGHWEYSRRFRDDPRSLAASAGLAGVWAAQLATHLRAAAAAEATEADAPRYRHNVAHDGSVAHLLSILQADAMAWPGMGSEVVVELWQATTAATTAARAEEPAVRVLYGGRVLTSSHPALGRLDMRPLASLLAYLDALVGPAGARVPQQCENR